MTEHGERGEGGKGGGEAERKELILNPSENGEEYVKVGAVLSLLESQGTAGHVLHIIYLNMICLRRGGVSSSVACRCYQSAPFVERQMPTLMNNEITLLLLPCCPPAPLTFSLLFSSTALLPTESSVY